MITNRLIWLNDMTNFLTWIEEQIISSKEDCKENKDFPNSYGAGYDNGVLRGLLDAYEYYTGKSYDR